LRVRSVEALSKLPPQRRSRPTMSAAYSQSRVRGAVPNRHRASNVSFCSLTSWQKHLRCQRCLYQPRPASNPNPQFGTLYPLRDLPRLGLDSSTGVLGCNPAIPLPGYKKSTHPIFICSFWFSFLCFRVTRSPPLPKEEDVGSRLRSRIEFLFPVPTRNIESLRGPENQPSKGT